MTVTELKKSLHKQIEQINDLQLLKRIYFMLENKDKVFIIPEHMKEGIKQGMDDIRNGNFITMEEFKGRYKKYLKD